jgi:hypothetical protein
LRVRQTKGGFINKNKKQKEKEKGKERKRQGYQAAAHLCRQIERGQDYSKERSQSFLLLSIEGTWRSGFRKIFDHVVTTLWLQNYNKTLGFIFTN